MIRSKRKTRMATALLGTALAVATFAAAPAAADNGLVVRDFVLTNAIAGREPTNDTAGFTVHDERAFAFARISNTGSPTAVNVVWHHEGSQHGSVWLSVGQSPGWRTWSSANLKPGNWSVSLVDAEGSVLVQRSFTVGRGADSMARASEPMIDDPLVVEPTSTATTDEADDSMFYPMR